MKKIAVLLFVSFFLGCQESEKKEKKPYREGDTYEWNGKTYQMKGVEYYPNGSDKFLVLGFDSLGKKYERHIGFYEDGKKKRIKLINPQIDTLQRPKKYNRKKIPVYQMFIGYILKEETFYENGKYRSWAVRNNNILDSSFNYIDYDKNGKIKSKSKDRKVNDMWISEEEKDGKITIDTSYFWK